MAGEYGETCQRCTGAAVATQTTDFHPFPGAGTVQHGPQRDQDQGRIAGNAEVRPVEVIVGPRRLPPAVELKPVVGLPVSGVGVDRIEGHGRDSGAVGQADHTAVPVHFNLPVLVIWIRAPGWLSIQIPVHLPFDARHDHPGSSHLHPRLAAAAGPDRRLGAEEADRYAVGRPWDQDAGSA